MYLWSILCLIILVGWVYPYVQVLLPFFNLETVIIFLRTIFPLYLQVLVEYVGGGDLSLRLRSGGLPLEQLREYTQQLVEALAYLHGKAVVHKDLRVSQWSANIQADVMPGETWNLYGFLLFLIYWFNFCHLQLTSCRLDCDGNMRLADYSAGKR